MNKFLTLVRRDMADNRGALVITPLVIASILLVVTLFASFTGNARFGFDPKDFSGATEQSVNQAKAEFEVEGGVATVTRGTNGRITVTGPDGRSKTIDDMIEPEQKKSLATVLPVGTAIAASLPLLVAAIAILFVLAGALHDERKDRTILFWKSMPVSDLQTAGAKLVSIVGIGLFFALLVAIVLHIAITTIAVMTLGNVGITGVPLLPALANASKLWLVMGLGLLVYVGWALPVYGWVSMVSAWAPKMPFVAAFAPLVVVPLVYMAVAFRGNQDDPILQALWEPATRLVGGPMFHGLEQSLNEPSSSIPMIPVADMLAGLAQSLTQPGFYVGLVIAAGFVYAASEIRRRRAM